MRPVLHRSDRPIGTEDCLMCKVVRVAKVPVVRWGGGQKLVMAYLVVMATVSVLLFLVLLGKL